MTREELNTLTGLCSKLELERLRELNEKYPEMDVLNMADDELYKLDDGDRLIEGLDIVIDAVRNMYTI